MEVPEDNAFKPAKAVVCSGCHCKVEKGKCTCPGPPQGKKKKVAGEKNASNQLLNGRSLLKHTKRNISNVPETRNRPNSETKSKGSSLKETKLLNNDVSVNKECLIIHDKEAVNVGNSIGSESNIFENDFDCVNSTTVVKNASSQTFNDKKVKNETTPVKNVAKVQAPSAPVKKGRSDNTKDAPLPEQSSEDHGEYATRGPRHACQFCPKTFRSNGKLNIHVFSHTGERPFACKHCHKAFSSKFKLVRHLLIHSEDRKFLCTVCERRFIRNDHLKNHYKVHDPRKVVFKCERTGCEKEYSSALSQRKHEAWHRAQDGELICLLCGVKHENVADLLVHLRRHSGSRLLKSPADRKFRCHVCERHFLTRKDVTRHLVVHTGERDFLCQFCPQRFGRKDHLVRHIKKSHHAPAKRKINKSILTLNKSAKTKKLTDDGNNSPIELSGESDEESAELLDEPPTPPATEQDLHAEASLISQTLIALPSTSGIDVSSSILPSETALDLFEFPDGTDGYSVVPPHGDLLLVEPGKSLENHDRKGDDLFEGTSQSLLYSEPTFDDDDYKTSDLVLNQSEPSGELLRYLLLSDTDAPLPGFSQIFNPCPPNSS